MKYWKYWPYILNKHWKLGKLLKHWKLLQGRSAYMMEQCISFFNMKTMELDHGSIISNHSIL
uniref:Uncharacterized protein n=1 Tax=Setaria italica TaxID=4555 RepID=K4AP60_SETIT